MKNARSDEDRKRFLSMVDLFKKYGDQYDLDYVLMAAQGYQESGLDQAKRSRVGAIGVMQVMPATARDKAVGIPDIEKLESNIHAGIKYNRWVVDNFYQDPAIIAPQQGALRLRVVQRGARAGSRASASRPRPRASTRTSGSTTWSWSRRSASAARRSPT